MRIAEYAQSPEGASELAGPPRRARVLLPLPLLKPYDYLAPEGLDLAPGAFVAAPLGPRVVPGVVWPGPGEDNPDAAKLRALCGALPAPPLSPAVLDFIEWTAAYCLAPLGSVLRLVMRSGDALIPPAGPVGYRAGGVSPARLSPQRARVLEVLADGQMAARALAARAGVSDAVLRGLAKAGALVPVRIDPDPPFAPPNLQGESTTLSPSQEKAAEALRDAVRRAGHRTILLDGVTGAGKTEVYFEAVAAALSADHSAQALIMLPEIALTLPFLDRVGRRFGAEPAAWHSELGAAGRRRTWRRVLDGTARLVVGARSALFLPYRNLRLIVVDEEHDGAYKQEDGVIYHARDLAVARASRGGFPAILASATPSLETVVNVDSGRYAMVRLPARFGGASLPDIQLVDMRREGPDAGDWLSPALAEAVTETRALGRLSLLFINRRGYAPLTLCRRCGHRMRAPHSDTFLVEHRFENRLVCHHTGYSTPKPDACPACRASASLAACGPGVERVAEEAARRWPDSRRAILSSDTAPTPAAMRAILDRMGAKEIDILIATQMAAKGHHFPELTLVGVIDADMGLAGGDLRAAEKTYQLVSQVTGRAGRGGSAGRALIQTYCPEAPVMQALKSGDRDAFLAAEAEGRRALGFPPYGRLVAVVLRSRNEKALIECANAHKVAAPQARGVELWGPAPAPFYRIRGEARIRFLVKARRDVHVQGYVAEWLRRVKPPGSVRRVVDIDPYSFL